jgi:hypothetical protein
LYDQFASLFNCILLLFLGLSHIVDVDSTPCWVHDVHKLFDQFLFVILVALEYLIAELIYSLYQVHVYRSLALLIRGKNLAFREVHYEIVNESKSIFVDIHVLKHNMVKFRDTLNL